MAILTGNLPTLVPPNFCTSHLTDGSTEFWCKLGGVLGRESDVSESESDEYDDGANTPHMVVVLQSLAAAEADFEDC